MWKELRFLIWTALCATFRKRSTWLLYLGLPVAGVIVSSLIYGSAGQTALKVGVVNDDGSETVAAETVRFLQSLDKAEVTLVTPDQLRRELAAGELDSGVVLGSGFSASVLAGKPDHIAVQSVKGEQVTAYVKAMLYGYIDNMAAMGAAAGGDSAAFANIYEHYKGSTTALRSEWVNDASVQKQMSYQSIGFLIMFMLTSAAGLSELILKNRENRTYFRIMASPVSAKTYVLSNVIVNLIIMLAQITVTLFVLTVVFRQSAGIPAPGMGLLLALFALVSVSLSLVIVAFSTSTSSSNALQNLIIHPTCILSGCYFPIGIMPDAVRSVAAFLPQNWLLQSIDRLQAGYGWTDIAWNLLILLAFAVFFFLLAAYKFGRNNDTRNFV
ncbi:ABC transporter permease [Paenibacillus thailandensis]|uniref:ABC transporter permease n=1 Tax=Paenibacillus thailandensis TaxID=393250 RepID=A0ABW5QUQ6_9BACL